MKWTPKKKYLLSAWSEREYSLPFRYTSAAKNIFMSSDYKRNLYPELAYLYPGYEELFNKYASDLDNLYSVLSYIESQITNLEKEYACDDPLLSRWWIGDVSDSELEKYLEELLESPDCTQKSTLCAKIFCSAKDIVKLNKKEVMRV